MADRTPLDEVGATTDGWSGFRPSNAATDPLRDAAPELLSALKEAAQVARNYTVLFHDAKWQARVDRWDAAIAKAEGR